MPRASGSMLTCVCCERELPRDAIAFIRRKPVAVGKYTGTTCAVCGEVGYRQGGTLVDTGSG